jgi:ABC-type dipeptide/oligopeptide/nickel transport system permease subunit
MKVMLTISVGFTVLYLSTNWNWAILVSLLIGLIGIFSPYLSNKVSFLWMRLARSLSLIFPVILLSLIYLLLLFPIALLSRIFGENDPLGLKNRRDSTFKSNKREFNKSSFEKTW